MKQEYIVKKIYTDKIVLLKNGEEEIEINGKIENLILNDFLEENMLIDENILNRIKKEIL